MGTESATIGDHFVFEGAYKDVPAEDAGMRAFLARKVRGNTQINWTLIGFAGEYMRLKYPDINLKVSRKGQNDLEPGKMSVYFEVGEGADSSIEEVRFQQIDGKWVIDGGDIETVTDTMTLAVLGRNKAETLLRMQDLTKN